MKFGLVIRNGRIVDGTGRPRFKGDIGIEGGKITRIGHLATVQAEAAINAEGMIVCPGFIDSHSHSDISLPFNPEMVSTIRQGITTHIAGNCGITLAPVNPAREELLYTQISPFLPPGAELGIEWKTFGEYLAWEDKISKSSNMAHLVGFGTIRIAVMGLESRSVTSEELGLMEILLIEAMKAGALGMSTGLIYPPDVYSRTEDIIALAKVVAKYGGVYASHVRGEGNTLIEAVEEAIEIGEKARISVEISHHKAWGRPNWGKTKETLRLMEDASARGVDVTCDQYPYEAGMTSLITLLPPWVHEGGIERLLDRLRSSEKREKIRQDIEQGISRWQNTVAECGWENIYVSSVHSEKNKSLEGKNMPEIAVAMGKPDEFTALCDLLLEERGKVTMIVFGISEDDIRRIMKHHIHMVGTDAWSVAPYGPTNVGKPHPRFYGTYPRILGKYVREERVLPLEEAVSKMTSLPARKFKLDGRGLLREGMWADVVVFDPERIIDKASFQEPHQYPDGVEYVLVNGVMVVDKSEQTKASPGMLLRNRLHKA